MRRDHLAAHLLTVVANVWSLHRSTAILLTVVSTVYLHAMGNARSSLGSCVYIRSFPSYSCINLLELPLCIAGIPSGIASRQRLVLIFHVRHFFFFRVFNLLICLH